MTMDQPYLSMTPEEVYDQYECSKWSKRGDSGEVMNLHISGCSRMSSEVRQELNGDLDVPYGSTDRQKLDIFGAKTVAKDAPVLVIIHGGYWHIMGKEDYSFMVKVLVEAGALVVMLGYELAPKVTLKQIIAMVKDAMTYILKMAKSRGSRGVYISGHSAGGHLAAMMLSEQWSSDDLSFIKGIAPLSGIFDVRPLIHYNCNYDLKLTEDEAWECSPAKYIDKVLAQCQKVKFMIAVGGDESPEFKRQSLQYSKLMKKGGMSVIYFEEENRDHFDLVEKFIEPSYHLIQELIKFMDL